MSEQPLGAMNAWGGRRADGGAAVRAVPEVEGEPQSRVSLDPQAVRDVVSLAATLSSGPLVATGAGLAWGIGLALLALGVWLLLLGVLLGIGGDR